MQFEYSCINITRILFSFSSVWPDPPSIGNLNLVLCDFKSTARRDFPFQQESDAKKAKYSFGLNCICKLKFSLFKLYCSVPTMIVCITTFSFKKRCEMTQIK